MTSRPLLVVLAAVFMGLATVMVVAAAVSAAPLALMAAVPLALTGLLMWYQGTGRLTANVLRGAGAAGRRRRGRHTTVGGPEPGGERAGADDEPWEDPFWREAEREARTRSRRRGRREREHAGGATSTGTGAGRRRRDPIDGLAGLSVPEAYDVLGLDRSAGEAAVRDAYREKAKVLHPDTDGGSAEAFQELNEAYELLVGE